MVKSKVPRYLFLCRRVNEKKEETKGSGRELNQMKFVHRRKSWQANGFQHGPFSFFHQSPEVFAAIINNAWDYEVLFNERSWHCPSRTMETANSKPLRYPCCHPRQTAFARSAWILHIADQPIVVHEIDTTSTQGIPRSGFANQ